MADNDSIRSAINRYSQEFAIYKETAEDVAKGILSILDLKHIPSRVEHRAKDPRSLLKKILVKQYADPWNDVTDKAGVRVIVYEPQNVDLAAQAIRDAYGENFLSIEDKRQVVDPRMLDYSGVHLQLAHSVSLATRELRTCEVQLRTAVQDAWSVVSHRVLYKPVTELPGLMQHAAYRLVALVELFDQEIDRIVTDPAMVAGDRAAPIMDSLENHYLAMANSLGDRRLTFVVVSALLPTVPTDELQDYPSTLSAFVATEEVRLRQFFARYGPHTDSALIPELLMVNQPESLMLWERLASRRHLVADAWQRAGLPSAYLEAFAAAAGLAVPS